MNKMITKTLLAAAVTTALGVLSSSAMAQTTVFPNFTVNEGSVVGAAPNIFTADKITGNYVEVITFNGTAASGTFDVALKWNAAQFVANDGTSPVPTQVGQTGSVLTAQYGLYALYSGKGTYTGSNGATTFNFTPGGTLQMFLDPNTDTTFNQPAVGSVAYTTSNSGDDIRIINGVPTFGQGTLDPSLSTCTGGINCGSFGATASIALTDAGKTYFTAPNPFYNVSFQSGQLNNFNPTGTQVINGSLDVIFAVPEPTSVALIGLGLLGLGLSRRRKQQA